MLLVGAGATASGRLGRQPPQDVVASGAAMAVSVGGVLLDGGGVALGCRRRRGGSFIMQVGGGGTFLQVGGGSLLFRVPAGGGGLVGAASWPWMPPE